MRATDTVCRQSGDGFVILLAEIEQPLDATFVAEKLLAAVALPHLIDEHELHVSIYPDDGNNADNAMFHAKANISALEFSHKDFLAGVALILKETGLAPCYLELELTESILMHDAEASAPAQRRSTHPFPSEGGVGGEKAVHGQMRLA